MHGLIFAELRKYVETKLGTEAWPTLIASAGLPDRIFMPIATYPDEDAVRLVTAASGLTGWSADTILQDFGEFIAPDLLRMYAGLLDKEWRTLDIIEHTEETIHRVVRSQNPGAEPPRLRCQRRSPSEIVIVYSSPRKLCGIAKGISRGIARVLEEEVTVREDACMHQGAAACEIVVRLEST
jgi:predicted hydrocarbon binding protein